MAASALINLSALLDDARCFDLVRQHRWPQGAHCPGCDSTAVIRNGRDEVNRIDNAICARLVMDGSTI